MSSSGTGKAATQPATNAIREWPGGEVGERLGCAKGNDEGEGRRDSGEMKDLRGEQWENRAFLPEHATDECVDADQQAELGEVRPKSERDRSRARCGGGHSMLIGRFALRQASKPPSRTARLSRLCPSSRLAAVIARSP